MAFPGWRSPWLLMVLAAVAVGLLSGWLTYLSQRTELRTTRIEDQLTAVGGALAEVRLALEQRVREDTMREYERRFTAIESSIVRIQDRLLNRAEAAYQNQAPYQGRWEAPDPPRMSSNEVGNGPR